MQFEAVLKGPLFELGAIGGDASYALYLSHPHFLLFRPRSPYALLLLLGTPLLVVLGIASHFALENPLLRMVRRAVLSPSARIIGMLSAINALCHPIISSVTQLGAPVAVLDRFGFSAVITFAIFALERISASESAFEATRPLGKMILAAAVAAAFLPIGQLSGIAVC